VGVDRVQEASLLATCKFTCIPSAIGIVAVLGVVVLTLAVESTVDGWVM
jgi:hypothetical protein